MSKQRDKCTMEFNDWVDQRGRDDPINPPTCLEVWNAAWDILGGPRELSTLSKEDRELAFDIMQREYATSGKSLLGAGRAGETV